MLIRGRIVLNFGVPFVYISLPAKVDGLLGTFTTLSGFFRCLLSLREIKCSAEAAKGSGWMIHHRNMKTL
ncbi:Hypothetical predicted protein [Cloeon dipterum]|uniref:Uncharacterized protein n=1 Tax=Cloeon dipterum TaxID=197152 RepID=A0A8S1CWN0_9INSE|nr:Hypothetical predicted protein [Cloeon dipterum]